VPALRRFVRGLVGALFLRVGRQLKHGRMLPFAQAREQHHLPVREFQRVAMRIGKAVLGIAEAGDPLAQLLAREEGEYGVALYVPLECQFGTGCQANRNGRFADLRETASD